MACYPTCVSQGCSYNCYYCYDYPYTLTITVAITINITVATTMTMTIFDLDFMRLDCVSLAEPTVKYVGKLVLTTSFGMLIACIHNEACRAK